MNREKLVQILNREGLSPQDVNEAFGCLRLVDEVALQILHSQIDYSMNALDVLDMATGLTRRQRAVGEAYLYAEQFVFQMTLEQDQKIPDVKALKSALTALRTLCQKYAQPGNYGSDNTLNAREFELALQSHAKTFAEEL